MAIAPHTGDRIRLLSMPEDPDPLAPGSLGTVVSVHRRGSGTDAWLQIDVEWDSGRSLMLATPQITLNLRAMKTDPLVLNIWTDVL